ncbi:sigma-54-dependent Fis family transcriptional regulator [Geobacter sulfurreducens]|jgi:two-component system nitrogen regulation response regulator GlnG|uniref:DNA-binding transcriptional regulator NtrC n=1 Tax=Geobacter sulfurreducens (strain ATCC 51573 / DSM 12127 / PCA) TaxID=243231 RepID=Q74EF9_GEOSL|nr:nitrogen fixation sigma-54 dependent transcriptional regulator GnfM [Geobacter sulfurreducens]AAR34330.1 nitrogen fixation master sigma-54-dependent transcriptional response regulator [Geobacter sulfurreducens PCA]ADI83845.1 nitrogen fixation master sigma-54-dependent transcriptional response regulator [Geobacter sulfurreducens KN400]AJY70734.1 transcriptional regulator [Geobacter sulfurreducens]QVW36245.1 sigma-54-dependent Fis family transcriptional regulator [Geobacter sulfurreducens]UAC
MLLNRILVADDEESMRWVLSKALRKKGFTVDLARDGEEALRLIQSNEYDLAILDIKMPGFTGLELLDKVRELKHDLLMVIMTAEASMKNAVEAMKRGAYDYITKPFDLDVIDAIIEKVHKAREITSQMTILREELKERYHLEKNIIGNSPAMREVYKTIGKVAPSDVTVLVQGESGTGKELIARAIHFNSKRIGKPFIALNCAAIPKDLLESELFGFEKGAFTGAVERKLGKFEQANGGTIFLDEIGDMPLDLQAKILRVLQEKEVTRTGGSQNIAVDVRIVAATNQNLEELVRKKQFREDLFYRLNVVPIQLVPLRERKEDVPLLVDYFLQNACAELEVSPKKCSPEAMALLTTHSWPGNVRELENTIKRAVILSSDPLLTPSDFPGLRARQTGSEATAADDLSLEALVDMKLRASLTNLDKMESGDIYNLVLKQIERPLIRFVLEKTRGNQVKGAEILGINRNTLRKKIQELGIELRKD